MGFFSGRDNRTPGEKIENVIGPSATLKGSIRSDGGLRVDGAFEGTIEVGGNVIIGEGGQVRGDVSAKNVTVGGQVVGNIDGQGRLEILATGQVLGDICVATVMIDEGGVFQGISRIRGFEQRALAAPADAAPPSRHATVVDVVAKGKPTPSAPAATKSNPQPAATTQARRDERAAPAHKGVTVVGKREAASQAPATRPTVTHQPAASPKPAQVVVTATSRNAPPNPKAEVDLDAIEPIILEGSASAS